MARGAPGLGRVTVEIALQHRFPGLDLDVCFAAPPGVTALFGRSGTGKTTLVNAVAGLMRPDSGRVAVDGRVLLDTEAGIWVPAHRRRIGYVFQEARLFPHLSVRQNLLYGRRFSAPGARLWTRLAGVSDGGAGVDGIVEMLGLGALMARRPGALSGGERQRVALGRALLSRPRLLLMDEPLAALDEARKAEILPYLERIRDVSGVPILYVSHSVAEVARLATTIVALESGRVAGAGPAARILADPDVAKALGVRSAGALLSGRVVAQHDDGLTEVAISGGTLTLPRIAAAVGSPVRLRIEAQDVLLSRRPPEGLSALNILAGRITAIRPGSGPGMMVQLSVGGDLLLARVTRRSATALGLAVGRTCYAITKTVSVHPQNVGTGELTPLDGI